jgi:outer membrane immunogenic protein
MKLYLLCAAGLAACLPGVAYAQDFDGVRIEARLGYETPTVSGDGDVYKIGSAVSYGGELGYDLKAGNSVVVGPYATYEFSTVKLCDGGFCLKEKGNLGAGARVGFAVSPTVLVYGKIGYARITFKASSSFGSDTASKGGVQGAIGVDVNFGKNYYGFAEINYGDYGKFSGVNLQRRHVATGLGVRF